MQGLLCSLVVLVVVAAHAQDGPSVEVPRYSAEDFTFLGHACDAGCTEEKAGFGWAELHGVTDPGVCSTGRDDATDGWVRGCRAHAEESTTPEQAGERWAIENELGSGRWCDGAGPRFRMGCLRQALPRDPGGGTNRDLDR